MHEFTRREALRKIGAGTLLTLGMWPGALAAKENPPPGSFKFIVVNDVHYMSKECGEWLGRVVQQMRDHQGVEFCIIAGDLTEKGKREDFGAVRDILRELRMPFFVQIGNHDYLAQNNRWAYERLFPRRLNYYFKHRGWQFVGLDTTEGQLYQDTQIQSDTFMWLRDKISKFDKRAPLVIFTHFPLGVEVKYRPGNADILLESFREHNLQAVFSGHWHGFTERHTGATTFTTNACCALKRGNHDGTTRKGYFVCTAKDGLIQREFIEVKTPVIRA